MKITTSEWTEVTGLTASSTYILQAQYRIGDKPLQPIGVMWLQVGSEPSEDDLGIIADTMKLNASTSIYVKPFDTPVEIVAQEVITGA